MDQANTKDPVQQDQGVDGDLNVIFPHSLDFHQSHQGEHVG